MHLADPPVAPIAIGCIAEWYSAERRILGDRRRLPTGDTAGYQSALRWYWHEAASLELPADVGALFFLNWAQYLNLGRVSDVTQILMRAEQGDGKAMEELLPLVYDELRKLAAHRMANEVQGHTLQPTALVHEAWLRLAREDHNKFEIRSHFFAAAAEAMRRILIDCARRKSA